MASQNSKTSSSIRMQDKLALAAVVLPLLGAVGGIMKVVGFSQGATLVVVLPAFFTIFFGWALIQWRKASFQATDDVWALRDARLQQQRKESVAAQQEELRKLRIRQQEEQDQIIQHHPTAEQLASMIDRHRAEYEALVQRRTA